MAFQGAGGWDPYTGEWVQGDIFPLGPGGNYYNADRQDVLVPSHPGNGQDDPSSVLETNGRKKRRMVNAGEDDQDYQPPGGKRVSNRLCPYLCRDV